MCLRSANRPAIIDQDRHSSPEATPMAAKLTRRQNDILTFVRRYTDTHGYPPSVREIGQAMGLTSSSTVHSHLAALERKGFLRRDPSKPRALEILRDNGAEPAAARRFVPLPIVGRVTAGEPILAEENIEDYLPVAPDLLAGSDGFALRVRGDSMIGVGIQDGDLLVVRRQTTAQNGDIVVARLGDEATVKHFYRESDRIRLQPANDAMEPILTRDVVIEGKAVAVFRRLH
jgi:repressor LexA